MQSAHRCGGPILFAMLTGVFRDRTRQRIGHAPADVLAHLLRSRSLKPHRFDRNASIGPFLVAHACVERGLVVELREGPRPCSPRELNRRTLLQELGYTLVWISPRELLAHPDRALAHIRQALR